MVNDLETWNREDHRAWHHTLVKLSVIDMYIVVIVLFGIGILLLFYYMLLILVISIGICCCYWLLVLVYVVVIGYWYVVITDCKTLSESHCDGEKSFVQYI